MRKFFFKFYWWLQGVLAPTLKYSQDLYEDTLKQNVNPTVKWIDLGCGHQLLPRWRAQEEKCLIASCGMIVGIDYDLYSLINHKNITLKVRGDITKLPFKDNFFDLVTANMVVEHLDEPEVQFREVSRILKPGGIFIFHTPNLFGYVTFIGRLIPNKMKSKLIYFFDGRREEDIFATWYRANTKKAINDLAMTAGFEVQKIKMIVTSAQFVMLPPLVIFELIWIRILMMRLFKGLRTNIIAILKKKQE